MKNIKIALTLLGVQLIYIVIILLSCVWNSTMFVALRVLAYVVWGFSLLYCNQCTRRYEHSKKNRRKSIIIFTIGCISVLTAQFVSATKAEIKIALIFVVFLFVIYLAQLILIFDIRKSMLDETVIELEQHPNKELFTGITKERVVKNHSLLVTVFLFGVALTYIGIPLLCSQDYFLGIKALIFLYAWDVAILLMRLYILRAPFSRFLLEVVCFHLSMMCLSFSLSRLNWAVEQTFFQIGCVVTLLPIVIGIIKDIRQIRKNYK